jgi:proteic killer suppression protein
MYEWYIEITQRVILRRANVQLLYSNGKVQKQCTDLKTARKLFGGNSALAISLFARINANEEPYDPCNIDEIAGVVRIVEVREVSKHYE